MKFGPVPLAQALGAVLAHSVAVDGSRLRKGRVLTDADLEAMREAGMTEVTVARLESGDIEENAAAAQLAAALVPDPDAAGLRLSTATTGRVNVYATGPGLVAFDTDAIHAVNAVDPMITVATVPPWQRLDTGGMVATVKIIAYGVSKAALAQACAAARGLAMRQAIYESAALIQTQVPGAPLQKGRDAIEMRLTRLGVALKAETTVLHRVDALASALKASEAEVLLILTGSATSDAMDVAPEALRAAGGQVTHFGMPVDPGNLLFFGALNGRPVIGLPGCARAPALNGADWVMERLLCGVEVTPGDISAMGVGGLLKEVPQRGRLREDVDKPA